MDQPTHLSGIFLYWAKPMLDDGPVEWDARLAFLAGLRMDTIITQFSVVGDRAWYASDHLAAAREGVDPTGLLLDAAARAGFKVHVGLATDERWWSVPAHPEEFASYVVEETDRNNRITAELVARYRGHEALAGLYTSHEIHLGQEGLQLTRDGLPALAEFCNRLIDESKRLVPELPVSNAPFFSLPGTVEEFEAMWRDLLTAAPFDIIMLQDGIGCDRHIAIEHLATYYGAMARACRDTSVEFWTDLELFDLNAPHLVSPERLAGQLREEAPHVSKVVGYSLANLTPEFVGRLPGV